MDPGALTQTAECVIITMVYTNTPIYNSFVESTSDLGTLSRVYEQQVIGYGLTWTGGQTGTGWRHGAQRSPQHQVTQCSDICWSIRTIHYFQSSSHKSKSHICLKGFQQLYIIYLYSTFDSKSKLQSALHHSNINGVLWLRCSPCFFLSVMKDRIPRHRWRCDQNRWRRPRFLTEM